MYGDFQCPACRSAEPGVKYAIDTYRDRVRFVWKDFPLSQIHPNAELAANAARCAETQGKFWEYHDALYASQPEWADERDPSQKFAAYAKDVGLNTDAFSSCLSAREQKAKVGADVAEGFHNSVDATPTFFINNRRYFGMSPSEWATQLDQALGVAGAVTSTKP
jgi:protein-disulfide isomerase